MATHCRAFQEYKLMWVTHLGKYLYSSGMGDLPTIELFKSKTLWYKTHRHDLYSSVTGLKSREEALERMWTGIAGHIHTSAHTLAPWDVERDARSVLLHMCSWSSGTGCKVRHAWCPAEQACIPRSPNGQGSSELWMWRPSDARPVHVRVWKTHFQYCEGYANITIFTLINISILSSRWNNRDYRRYGAAVRMEHIVHNAHLRTPLRGGSRGATSFWFAQT